MVNVATYYDSTLLCAIYGPVLAVTRGVNSRVH